MRRALPLLSGLALVFAAAAPALARGGGSDNDYRVTNLVSDQAGVAPVQDSHLVNGWGITAGPTTPWWVSDNGMDASTLYSGTGTPFPPGAPLAVDVAGAPTGTVFNTSTLTSAAAFPVSAGGVTAFARFIFATESGTIRGWAPTVPPQSPGVLSTSTELIASAPDAVFKGLAIGQRPAASGGGFFLFATDFHHAQVDVFDSAGTLQNWAGAFIDPGIPAGYAPFGIQNLNGTIFVTYAKQDAAAHDEIGGEGFGFVSAFGTDGTFLGRVASGDELNAPWGLAWAPSSGFGRFSGDLIVGNLGDGRISAYAMTSDGWEARGLLKGDDHRPLAIDGLWGIGFGNGAAAGPPNVLYFAAGPQDQQHGLFGTVTAAS